MLRNVIGIVNPSQSNPNDTIEASDINGPVNQIAAVLNGNVDSANLATDAVVTAAIANSAITPGKTQNASWVWTTVASPTYSNLTVGNGTALMKYEMVGKTARLIYQLAWGSTTAFTSGSSIGIGLPVAASADYAPFVAIGQATFYTSGAAQIDTGVVALADANTLRPYYSNLGGTSLGAPVSVGQVNNTGPFSWATNCVMFLECTYEIA